MDGKELYERYNLTKSEISYVESLIRPMEDTLFDKDSMIDPEFANFNLEEYGVKVGDRIVYTPRKMEVIVVEDNKVYFEGEVYSIPIFTAKYMPHNKRSISGVCQGPKYFTFNGISLYKLKESFLKKK